MKTKLKILFLLLLFAGTLAAQSDPVTATKATDFLNSIGVNTAVSTRGENLEKTIEILKYTGFRWVRLGYNPVHLIATEDMIALGNEGFKVTYGTGSGVPNGKAAEYIERVIDIAGTLADNNCLLAIEGPNEPNGENWAVWYDGVKGGGKNAATWVPVAQFQRDLYSAVKSDAKLKNYPVWGISEIGAETDNSGLQYLTIPEGANTLMPAGTQFADFANIHNYFVHPSFSGLHLNQTWISASPGSDCKVDGLYGNQGKTWYKGFTGYSEAQLETLPRVTTETGTTIEGKFTEEMQGYMYMSMYLAQFKRNWSYTSIYLLRDRSDEAGNQSFGFYSKDYVPRKSALYLHNLTTILDDKGVLETPEAFGYSIPNQPASTHDLLLQKSNGNFELIVWAERFAGYSDNATVKFSEPQAKVKLYNPVVGTTPIETYENVSEIPLTMTMHPYIIEIVRSEESAIDSPEETSAVKAFFLQGANQIQLVNAGNISEISLYNLTGNLILKKNKPKSVISVENLETGIYLIRLKDINGNVSVFKTIKL
ncbi:MAG: T9SS type A sorting domain-containing protein [Candidatus Symbiothrix sp.]|jgi:hypothetical protein|nr:T9SS type A sorting domain-containing protein [Candidatus Symbiothrix sp.]